MSTRARRLGPLSLALALALVVASVTLPGGGSASADDRLFQLTVLHFGAGQSAVGPHDGAGGLDRFVELVRREHIRAEQTGGDVVIGLGDQFAPGPEFAAARAEPGRPLDALALGRVPADAYVIGDHDLDLGADTLAQFIDDVGRGTFLSATLDPAADPALGPLVDRGRIAQSTVVTRWGRPIGVVGVTSPRLAAAGAVDVDADVVPAVQAEIDRLSDADVDIVILASHLESLPADQDLAGRLTGVDLVLSGGGDDVLADPGARLAPGDEVLVAGPYPLLQADAAGVPVPVAATSGRYRYLGRLVAWFDSDGVLVRLAPSSGPLLVTGSGPGSVASQPFVRRRVVDVTRARVAAQPVTPLAVSQVDLDGVRAAVRTAEGSLGNLVADGVLATARRAAERGDRRDPDVALVGSGALGFDHVVAAGPVTVRDTFDLASNDRLLVSGPMTGARLKRVLEFAVSGAADVSPRWVQVAGLAMVVDIDQAPLVLDAAGHVTQAGRRIRSVVLASGREVVREGRVVPGRAVTVAFDETLLAMGHPLGAASEQWWVGATVQQSLADHLVNELGGAVGARQYPAAGEGRIVRPGVPPRP